MDKRGLMRRTFMRRRPLPQPLARTLQLAARWRGALHEMLGVHKTHANIQRRRLRNEVQEALSASLKPCSLAFHQSFLFHGSLYPPLGSGNTLLKIQLEVQQLGVCRGRDTRASPEPGPRAPGAWFRGCPVIGLQAQCDERRGRPRPSSVKSLVRLRGRHGACCACS